MATRTQITTDAFPFYQKAIPECFGTDADFGQVRKLFGEYGQRDNDARYSPGPIVEVISKVRQGSPDPQHISTSFVETESHDADAASQADTFDERFQQKAIAFESRLCAAFRMV